MGYKVLALIICLSGCLVLKAQSGVELFKDASANLEEGRNVSAYKLFTQYIESDQTNSEAYFGRAKAGYWIWRMRDEEDGQLYNAVLSDLDSAFLLDSTSAYLNYWIADVILSDKDKRAALTFYDRAVKYNQSKEKYYRRRAYCLMHLGEFERSIKNLEKANELALYEKYEVDRKVLHEGNYSDMAWCYAKNNQLDLAIKYIKKAIQLNPRDNIHQMHHGVYLSIDGQIKKSMKVYKGILKSNPYFGIVYLFMGDIYVLQGDTLKANQFHAKARGLGIEYKVEQIEDHLDLIFTKT